MLRLTLILLLAVSLLACNNAGEDARNKEINTFKDFSDLFQPVKTPKLFSDTSLLSFTDSNYIGVESVLKFIPDTILTMGQVKEKQFNLRPVGKIITGNLHYLLLQLISKKNSEIIVCLFNEEGKFITYLPLVDNFNKDGYRNSVNITEEPTFIKSREKKEKNNIAFTRNGFAFDEAENKFLIVITDSNENLTGSGEIFNPVDTLPMNNKFSGRYEKNNRSYISVRDGRNEQQYIFFIHFEKNSGDCNGEVKGEMTMVNENTGLYTEASGPCSLTFNFTKNAVEVTEENCGNKRGLDCLFDDTFQKKKLK